MCATFTKLTAFIRRSCSYMLLAPHTSATTSKCVPIQPSASLHLTPKYFAADSGMSRKSKMSASSFKMRDYPVEKDLNKLVTHCCGVNYFQTGDDVKLKPDSEYPEWLYNIDTGGTKKLHELDPNSKEYWLKVRLLARQRKNQLRQLRHKVLKQF